MLETLPNELAKGIMLDTVARMLAATQPTSPTILKAAACANTITNTTKKRGLNTRRAISRNNPNVSQNTRPARALGEGTGPVVGTLTKMR